MSTLKHQIDWALAMVKSVNLDKISDSCWRNLVRYQTFSTQSFSCEISDNHRRYNESVKRHPAGLVLLLLLLINIIRSSPYYSDIIWKEYLLQPTLYTQLIIWYWKFATKRTLVIHWWFIIGDLWLATEDNFTGNDDVMKTSRRWENFQYYWPLVRKQLIPSTMGQRCGSLMVAWLSTWLFNTWPWHMGHHDGYVTSPPCDQDIIYWDVL